MIYSAPLHPLTELLAPPPGFTLARLICTTYTLSMTVLLELAGAVAQSAQLPRGGPDDWERSQSRKIQDLYGGKETIRAARIRGAYSLTDLCLEWEGTVRPLAERVLRVFSGTLPMPSAAVPPAAAGNAAELFQRCGKAVSVPGGLFHPKLLLACFRSGGGAWRYRMQISSQNLTRGAGLELGIQLEGSPSYANTSPNGADLLPFLRWLYKSSGLDENAPELSMLEQTSFLPCLPPEGHDAYARPLPQNIRFAFNTPGHPGCLAAMQADFGTAPVKVYTPFLPPPDAQGRFYLHEKLAVSAYHTNLTHALYQLRHSPSESPLYCSGTDSAFLHAKLYCQDRPDGTLRVWLGSANASRGGLERNVELMAGFTLSPSPKAHGEFADPRTLFRQKNVSNPRELTPAVTFLPAPFWDEAACFQSTEHLPQARAFLSGLTAEASVIHGQSCRLEVRRHAAQSHPALENAQIDLAPLNEDFPESTTPTAIHIKCINADSWAWEPLPPPPGGTLKARLRLDGLPPVYASIPLTWRGTPPPEAQLSPPPMNTLLDDVTLEDAIPRCSAKGFYVPQMSLYERLAAYLASWHGAPEGTRRILSRIDAAQALLRYFLAKYPDAPDVPAWEARLEDFAQLREWVNALLCSGKEAPCDE